VGGAPSGEGGSAGANTAGSAGAGGSGAGGSPATGGSSGGSGAGPEYPADLLDLTNWKLTLPIAAEGTSKPWEVKQPELGTFSIEPYFRLNDVRDGVVFRAHAGGVTTSNSGYPRSELREMANGGKDLASWSSTSGNHAMTIVQAITHLPVVKPHVVAGQIHDAADDVVMVRLEGKRLFIEGGGNDLGVLDAAYQLGAVFSVKLVAASGRIRAYYQDMDTPKVDVARSVSGCYFKAGAYTQSNTSKGDEASAYGEVVIYHLEVTHTQ
jgi:poly(beta-D-mannuronate) lyase